MKKVLIIILAVFFLTGCSKSKLENISYDEFKQKIEAKETFVLYVSRTGCTHCEAYEPILRKVLNDYDITVYKLNLANVSQAEENAITKKVGLEGTPTLIYIKKGVSDIDGSMIGENTYENTVDFFKEYEMIEG
jgi:predicted bacteriocin transport accessory protein